MALLEIYFDESSTHVGARSLCVAGFIFESTKAVALSVEWEEMLKKYRLPYFHMSECAHNTGVYKHLSAKECDDAARDAISIIKRHAIYAFANSIEVEHFNLIPTHDFFSSPYTFLCWFGFMAVRHWANVQDYGDDINYIFESGAEDQSEADQFLSRVAKEPDLKRQYRYLNHFFRSKRDALPLQCADLLVWHWFTHLRRLAGGQAIRKDFASLMEIDNSVLHFDQRAVLRLNAANDTRQEQEVFKATLIPGYQPYDDYRKKK